MIILGKIQGTWIALTQYVKIDFFFFSNHNDDDIDGNSNTW